MHFFSKLGTVANAWKNDLKINIHYKIIFFSISLRGSTTRLTHSLTSYLYFISYVHTYPHSVASLYRGSEVCFLIPDNIKERFLTKVTEAIIATIIPTKLCQL